MNTIDRILRVLQETKVGEEILHDLAGELARLLFERGERFDFKYAILSRRLSAEDMERLAAVVGPTNEAEIPPEFGRPTATSNGSYWTGEHNRGTWWAATKDKR